MQGDARPQTPPDVQDSAGHGTKSEAVRERAILALLSETTLLTDFVEAFAFMTRVADMAEELDHHPEWCNVYKRVSVDLITHDVDGLSDLDFTLALRMEEPL